MDIYDFVGKKVEVVLYRKRYRTDGHIKVFSGVLTDVGINVICLENNGSYHWIPKPYMYKDKVKVIENG